MYTVKSFTDIVDKALRSRIVTVTFTEDGKNLVQPFRFSIGENDIVVKKQVKQFLDELNVVHVPISGDITFVPPEQLIPEPTAEELEKAKIAQTRKELEVAKKDVELGLLTAQEYELKLAEIKAKK